MYVVLVVVVLVFVVVEVSVSVTVVVVVSVGWPWARWGNMRLDSSKAKRRKRDDLISIARNMWTRPL